MWLLQCIAVCAVYVHELMSWVSWTELMSWSAAWLHILHDSIYCIVHCILPYTACYWVLYYCTTEYYYDNSDYEQISILVNTNMRTLSAWVIVVQYAVVQYSVACSCMQYYAVYAVMQYIHSCSSDSSASSSQLTAQCYCTTVYTALHSTTCYCIYCTEHMLISSCQNKWW